MPGKGESGVLHHTSKIKGKKRNRVKDDRMKSSLRKKRRCDFKLSNRPLGAA